MARGRQVWATTILLAAFSGLTMPRSVWSQAREEQLRLAQQTGGGAQSEPMVAPVKRVRPETPTLEGVQTTDTKGATAASGTESSGPKKSKSSKRNNTKRKVTLIGEQLNCDTGYQPDAAGKSCVKAAAAKPAPSKPAHSKPAKKKKKRKRR